MRQRRLLISAVLLLTLFFPQSTQASKLSPDISNISWVINWDSPRKDGYNETLSYTSAILNDPGYTTYLTAYFENAPPQTATVQIKEANFQERYRLFTYPQTDTSTRPYAFSFVAGRFSARAQLDDPSCRQGLSGVIIAHHYGYSAISVSTSLEVALGKVAPLWATLDQGTTWRKIDSSFSIAERSAGSLGVFRLPDITSAKCGNIEWNFHAQRKPPVVSWLSSYRGDNVHFYLLGHYFLQDDFDCTYWCRLVYTAPSGKQYELGRPSNLYWSEDLIGTLKFPLDVPRPIKGKFTLYRGNESASLEIK